MSISTSFPTSEIFGTKLVNGHSTHASLLITNNEANPVTVSMIGGSLWTLPSSALYAPNMNLRNLSTTRYNLGIEAGASQEVSYKFGVDMQPQDLRLELVAVIEAPPPEDIEGSDGKGAWYTLNAFNGTVSVVEPETSIFDPQM